MKIALFCSSEIPAKKYGGTQRVFLWLAKGLVELGHQVILYCHATEALAFEVRDYPDDQNNIDIDDNVDCLHFFDPISVEPKNFPYLVTIHGNGKPGEEFLPNTVFLSQDHAHRHQGSFFVYNGLDPSEYPLKILEDRKNRALFLAKASWAVKNLKGAIRLCRQKKIPLEIAGGYAPWYWRWDSLLTSHGEVDLEAKLKLLNKASFLLNPVLWDEPFGLSNIEALCTGTPVMGTRRGALPEIVTEKCGFLSNSFEELLLGLDKVKNYDPEACRQRVLDCFSHIEMAKNYLELYRKVNQEVSLTENGPKLPLNKNPAKKYPF